MQKMFVSPFGIILIVVGVVCLYIGYSGGSPGTAAIGWGAILFGTLFALLGLHQYVERFLNPTREDPEIQYGHAEVRLLIQCMGVMARADGNIDPKEVETIEEIHARMLGIAINSQEVSEILSEFDENFDINQRLQENRSKVSPLMKRKIVQACHLVMASDLKIRQSEISKIVEIGASLGFSRQEVEEIIAVAEI